MKIDSTQPVVRTEELAMKAPWWATAVFYQIYPLSFQDTNADGFGDLRGIIGRLDHLSDTLGVDAIWLSPFYRSPMRDWGYDVADHTDVDPIFGTIADAKQLIEAAHERKIRVVVDYVMNHTSDLHPWFVESRSSKDNPKRDWYVWRDPSPDGGPPNNWVSVFSGPSWTLDPTTGQYYRNSYLATQPDLNWRNPEVVDAMEDVARFWLELGVDGFRVDAAHQMMKDPLERDNPPVPEGYVDPYKDMGEYGRFQHIYDLGHEDVHACHRRLRSVLDEYPDRVAVSEVHVFDLEEWALYYGTALDELHMPFNFHLMAADWNARSVRETVDAVLGAIPSGATTNWTLGNHDEHRIASRLGPEHARLAAILLLTLPGAAFMYYGDEIGMTQVHVSDSDARDPWGENVSYLSRDGCRTPMQWTHDSGAGFTSGEPWLPFGPDLPDANVATQLDDPDSILALYQSLLRLRASDAIRAGDFRSLDQSDDDMFVFERRHGEDRIVVALNFSDNRKHVDLGDATTVVSTEPGRTGGVVRHLRPREGIVAIVGS